MKKLFFPICPLLTTKDSEHDLSDLPDRLDAAVSARQNYLDSALMASRLCKKKGTKKKARDP